MAMGEFKGIKCPFYMFNNCRMTSLEISQVEQHIHSIHEVSIYSTNVVTQESIISEETKNGNYKRGGLILKFDENIFICVPLQRKLNFKWGIYLIGSEENAKKYQVRVTVKTTLDPSPNSKFEINWMIPVNSIMNLTGDSFDNEIHTAYCDWDELKVINFNSSLETFKIFTTYKIRKLSS